MAANYRSFNDIRLSNLTNGTFVLSTRKVERVGVHTVCMKGSHGAEKGTSRAQSRVIRIPIEHNQKVTSGRNYPRNEFAKFITRTWNTNFVFLIRPIEESVAISETELTFAGEVYLT